jgi:hypothetical protein
VTFSPRASKPTRAFNERQIELGRKQWASARRQWGNPGSGPARQATCEPAYVPRTRGRYEARF